MLPPPSGNIRAEAKNGTTTKTYAYDNADWVDLLTSVNGNTITYDANGNPLTYHNGTTSYTGLTWEHGRQLTSITTGGKTYTYTYDADGIRTQKVVDGVTHTYITQNGKLVRESFPYGDTTIIMDFIYDESGLSCCGTRKNLRAYAIPRFFRPLPLARLL